MARNVQVLIVDEARERRMALKRQLALAGFAVVGEAGFGQEAVVLARELAPDIVLLAFEEPLARALRTIESLALAAPQAPIIAVSALSSGEEIRKAMVSGARDYIVRPFSQQRMQEAIRGVLQFDERRRERQDVESDEVEQGTVVTVFGAKGGVGKTTLAANLAVSLGLITARKVALIDLDMHFGDAAVMMNLAPQRSIADLARDTESVDRETLKGFLTPHESGVMLLAAPAQLDERQVISGDETRRIVQELAQMFDYVVVDTPPALTESVLTALEMSTLILMITTLEITSVKSAKISLQMLNQHQFSKDRVKLVLNHANSANTLKQRDIEDVLGQPMFWTIPYDIEVANAGQLGQLVIQSSPKSKSARTLADLASAISGATERRGGLVSRILGRA